MMGLDSITKDSGLNLENSAEKKTCSWFVDSKLISKVLTI